MHLTTALYHCPCYKSPADLSQTASDTVNDDEESYLSLVDSRIPYSLFSIEELYYCDDCNTHRCPRCVMEEVVSVYCPNCLFEVPGRHGTPGVYDAHCPRNCFRCPSCLSSMQTHGDERKGYHLDCSHCHWSTIDAGLSINRPVGITQQIAVQRPNLKKERFESIKRSLLSEQQGRLQERESEGSRLYRQYQRAMQTPTKSDTEPYVAPTRQIDDETETISHLLSSTSLDHLPKTSTPHSGYAVDKSTLHPIPTPLRSKRTKRCRQCRLLLVKPDPKPTSLHFRSRLYARTVLPTISFYSPYINNPSPTTLQNQEAVSEPSQWFIKVQNALPEEIHVSLSTANETVSGDQVVISTPELVIGGNSEEWDRDKKVVTRGVGGELVWSGAHYAAVSLEITRAKRIESAPQQETINDRAGVKLAVFVKMTWRADRDHDYRREGSEANSGKEEKELGFWIVLDTARTNPRPKASLKRSN